MKLLNSSGKNDTLLQIAYPDRNFIEISFSMAQFLHQVYLEEQQKDHERSGQGAIP